MHRPCRLVCWGFAFRRGRRIRFGLLSVFNQSNQVRVRFFQLFIPPPFNPRNETQTEQQLKNLCRLLVTFAFYFLHFSSSPFYKTNAGVNCRDIIVRCFSLRGEGGGGSHMSAAAAVILSYKELLTRKGFHV